MKVFISRAEGATSADLCEALDGELVTMVAVPCGDPQCGSHGAMVGVGSGRFTTCFTVADRDITFTQYVAAVRDGVLRQADGAATADDLDEAELLSFALRHVQLARSFRPGELLRRVHSQVAPRRRLAA